MKKLLAAAALSMITASTTAGAVEYPYIGLDYVGLNWSSRNFNEVSPEAARLRFGAYTHKYIVMEAHVLAGVADDGVVRSGTRYNLSVDGIYSLNLGLRIPLGDVGSLYGFGGYGITRITRQASGLFPGLIPDESVNDDDFTYGATLELRIWENWGFEVDYTTYLDNDVNELTAVGVGVRRRL